MTERRTIGAGSFSRLKDYEQCPHRAFLLYVERRPKPAQLDNTHADEGQRIHKLGEDYIKGISNEFPDEFRKVEEQLESYRSAFREGLVEVEQDWGFDPQWQPCDWFADQIWLRIKCDVVHHIESTYFEVCDWKSGKSFGKEVEHASQGQLYAIAAFARYPDLEGVRTKFTYTKEGKSRVREYVRNDMPNLMKSWDERLTRMTGATIFPARPNKSKCRFCPYAPTEQGDGSCAWGVPQ
jgi:CRISPR/Cas system-associated exonuclease Cas4 (RecB family)